LLDWIETTRRTAWRTTTASGAMASGQVREESIEPGAGDLLEGVARKHATGGAGACMAALLAASLQWTARA